MGLLHSVIPQEKQTPKKMFGQKTGTSIPHDPTEMHIGSLQTKATNAARCQNEQKIDAFGPSLRHCGHNH
jgi:hypothetical protein